MLLRAEPFSHVCSELRKRPSCSILYRLSSPQQTPDSHPMVRSVLVIRLNYPENLPFILVILLAESLLKLVVSNVAKYHNAEFTDHSRYGRSALFGSSTFENRVSGRKMHCEIPTFATVSTVSPKTFVWMHKGTPFLTWRSSCVITKSPNFMAAKEDILLISGASC